MKFDRHVSYQVPILCRYGMPQKTIFQMVSIMENTEFYRGIPLTDIVYIRTSNV